MVAPVERFCLFLRIDFATPRERGEGPAGEAEAARSFSQKAVAETVPDQHLHPAVRRLAPEQRRYSQGQAWLSLWRTANRKSEPHPRKGAGFQFLEGLLTKVSCRCRHVGYGLRDHKRRHQKKFHVSVPHSKSGKD